MFTEEKQTELHIGSDGVITVSIITSYYRNNVKIGEEHWQQAMTPDPVYMNIAEELLDEEHTMFNEFLDPKCNWAINNMHLFPVEVNTAPYEMLLRVPGIGVTSAKRIMSARRAAFLDFDGLRKIGVVLRRAQFFITCKGRTAPCVKIDREVATRYLIASEKQPDFDNDVEQTSLFDCNNITREDIYKCVSGQM